MREGGREGGKAGGEVGRERENLQDSYQYN